ncbi:MAG: type IX secretion system membrane protein PorP/SprF, partial [Cyclobacteriaceae bacterium]
LTQAQQDGQYTQYMFNGLVINPAFAGSHDALNASILYKNQWVGIEGAPNTATVSAHAPIKNDKVGLGLLIMSDNIGIHQRSSLAAMYAYKVKLGKDRVLSMGLQAGFNRYKADYTIVSSEVEDPNDPYIDAGVFQEAFPEFGAGFYYQAPKFFVGVSAPRLNQSKRIIDNTGMRSMLFNNHFFITSGYLIDLSSDWQLQPGFLIRVSEGTPVSYDLNTNVILRNVLWLGCSYRSLNSMNFLTQMQLTSQMRMGYAFDMPVAGAGDLRTSSHEIMISYMFRFSYHKVVSTRYFW